MIHNKSFSYNKLSFLRKQESLFILLLLLFIPSIAFAQNTTTDTTKQQKKDTVTFKLKFEAGDTIYYRVDSFDSISIDYGTPLIKSRYEKIKVVCDSVSKEGHFFLTQQLVDFMSVEEQDTEKTNRNSSPWLGRKARFEIDSVGNRYSYGIDDSLKAALCPGGAFQPYLFFPFTANQKALNETWLTESMDYLPENGVPIPVLRQSSLLRARKPLDTLGDSCNSFEFIKTGQGTYYLNTNTEKLAVTIILNGFGVMDISTTRFIPVHFYSTVEQNLTIHEPDDVTKPGKHQISTNFTLLSIKHKKINNNIKRNKKVR
jgi:hypothetical protein